MWNAVRLTVPTLMGRTDEQTVRSSLARLLASGAARTRVELVRSTGLSRTTVNTQVDALVAAGAVVEDGVTGGGRGRPAHRLALAARAGVVLVADVGVHSARLAVVDLAQNVLAHRLLAHDIAAGTEESLEVFGGQFRQLLDEAGIDPAEVKALTMGLPGPVDSHLGRPVRPPIMPGWDGYPVGETLAEAFNCPVLVDNDVNLMALGEARARSEESAPLLFIKIGTGIGGGLVSATGELHRGADGAAGDIGHIRVPGADDVVCQCGNVGCVEAVASAGAMLRQLPDLRTIQDLADRAGDGDTAVVRAIRTAASTLGEVVATLVHFYNPRTIVLGGLITAVSDDVLAGVRSVVYRRALPLATRNLSLTHSSLGKAAGLAGGAAAAIELVLSPANINQLLRG